MGILEALKSYKLWLVLLVIVGLSVALAFSVQSRKGWEEKASSLEKELNNANEKVAANNKVIDALAIELANQKRDTALLASVQEDLNKVAGEKEERIRKLMNENKELRDWASIKLPAAIVQLRKRPAFNSYKDYQSWLSGPDPVQPAGVKP